MPNSGNNDHENEKAQEQTAQEPTSTSDASKLNHPKPTSRPTTPKSAIKGSGQLRKEPLFSSRTDLPKQAGPTAPKAPLFPSWNSGSNDKADVEKSEPDKPKTPLFPSWNSTDGKTNQRPPTRPMAAAKPEPLFPSRPPTPNPAKHDADPADTTKPKTPLFPSSTSKPRSSESQPVTPDKPLFPTGGFKNSKAEEHKTEQPPSIFGGFSNSTKPETPAANSTEEETEPAPKPQSYSSILDRISPTTAAPQTDEAPEAEPEPETTSTGTIFGGFDFTKLRAKTTSTSTPETGSRPAAPEETTSEQPKPQTPVGSIFGGFEFMEPKAVAPTPEPASETKAEPQPEPKLEPQPKNTTEPATAENPETPETPTETTPEPPARLWTDSFSSLKPVGARRIVTPAEDKTTPKEDDFGYTPLFDELGAKTEEEQPTPAAAVTPATPAAPEAPATSDTPDTPDTAAPPAPKSAQEAQAAPEKPKDHTPSLVIGHQADLKPSTNPFSAQASQPAATPIVDKPATKQPDKPAEPQPQPESKATHKPTGHGNIIYRLPADNQLLEAVDVAVVLESTYPFAASDLAVSVQEIIRHNPDLTFGVIHLAKDSNAPTESMFEFPVNVKWVDVMHLNSESTTEKFQSLIGTPVMDDQLQKLLDAIEAAMVGEYKPMRQLYEEAINPQTRTWLVWGALGHREFMNAAIKAAGAADDISLSQLHTLMHDFFLRAYTLLDRVLPTARVYHAHASGNAALLAAAGALQNDGKYLLTEHNLNIRDTINTLLDRDYNRHVTREAHRKLTTDTFERFWTRWWLELGAINYAQADLITYLYPEAIMEAQELGGDVAKSEVLPTGIEWEDLEIPRIWRQQAVPKLERKISWKLAVVGDFQPSKGLIEVIEAVNIMVKRGKTDVRVDLLEPADGSTTHEPEYYSRCVAHIKQFKIENYVRLRSVKDVRDVLHEYDALVVPSFQENQPRAALVAMTMGVPILGTQVGGMAALVTDEVTDARNNKIGASGELVPPGDTSGLATLMTELTQNPVIYRAWHENALARIKAFYLLPQVMRRYNAIYRSLGAGKHGVFGTAPGR